MHNTIAKERAAKKIVPAPSRKLKSEPWKAFQVRDRNKEIKREAVLRTAAQLYLEYGYQKTSMSLLSAKLKITKPSLYYYFSNKEEILVECYRVGIAQIDECLRSSGLEPGSALLKLRFYVHAYTSVVLTADFGRCVAMIDDSELSVETRRGVRDLKRRIDVSIRGLIQAGIKDKSIAPCNPKLVSFAIAGTINWAGTWYKPDGELSPEQIAESFTEILTASLVPAALPRRGK